MRKGGWPTNTARGALVRSTRGTVGASRARTEQWAAPPAPNLFFLSTSTPTININAYNLQARLELTMEPNRTNSHKMLMADLTNQPICRATNDTGDTSPKVPALAIICTSFCSISPRFYSIRQAPPLCHGDFFFLLFCLPTLLLVSFKQLSFDFGPILVFVPCRFVFFRRLEEVLCCFESNCDLHRCCSFLFLRHPYEIV